MGRVLLNSIQRLSIAGAYVGGIMLFFLVMFVVYGIAARYVFVSPTAAAIELPSYLFLMIVVLTLAYVHSVRGHIGVELVVVRFPQKVQRVFAVVGNVLFLVYAVVIAWAGWRETLEYFRSGEFSEALHIPFFAVQVLLPIGMILLCLQILVETVKELTKLRKLSSK